MNIIIMDESFKDSVVTKTRGQSNNQPGYFRVVSAYPVNHELGKVSKLRDTHTHLLTVL
jgi:hypothetical protein